MFLMEEEDIKLILNDEHRQRAGIGSLSKRCQYCSEALAAYPLILSDDAGAAKASEQYWHRFERLPIPARWRCSSFRMSLMSSSSIRNIVGAKALHCQECRWRRRR